MASTKRIIFIGDGAIGRPAAHRIARGDIPGAELLGVVVRKQGQDRPSGIRYFTDIDEALALGPDLVVEAAGGEAFRRYAPHCISRGIDFLAVSVAAMADPEVEKGVRSAISSGNGRLYIASGATGALEALSAGREAGLETVTLTQRKPLRAFPGAVLSTEEDTVMSSGTARDAAMAFPKNANISAAIALAGLGFDETSVTVIADPRVDANIAELFACGAFGELRLSMRNTPSELNPSTARLASLSVIAAIRRSIAPIVVPA